MYPANLQVAATDKAAYPFIPDGIPLLAAASASSVAPGAVLAVVSLDGTQLIFTALITQASATGTCHH